MRCGLVEMGVWGVLRTSMPQDSNLVLSHTQKMRGRGDVTQLAGQLEHVIRIPESIALALQSAHSLLGVTELCMHGPW